MRKLLKLTLLSVALSVAVFCGSFIDSSAEVGPPRDLNALCNADFGDRRLVCADVSAIDQMLVYNRFGSFNPFGMMFALSRDLTKADDPYRDGEGKPVELTADVCRGRDGTEVGSAEGINKLEPGNVRLKDCKRPRPMVLRAAVNDVLQIRLRNMLTPAQPGFSETFCRSGEKLDPAEVGDIGPVASTDRKTMRRLVSVGSQDIVDHGEASCVTDTDTKHPQYSPVDSVETDWPKTRGITFALQGLSAVPAPGKTAPSRVCLGLEQLPVGGVEDCYFEAEREGTYFLSSTGAPAGGEGDGGSVTHGLFGAVIVEPTGSKWYRSQVSQAAFDAAWEPASDANAVPHARKKPPVDEPPRSINYEAVSKKTKLPVLNLVSKPDPARNAVEIIHADLNAIVFRDGSKTCPLEDHTVGCYLNFREFSVFFHDELKTFYTNNFEELGKLGQLAGVRDGFGINYGASGMGTLLLANRKGIGPAADCKECLYEEFFLASWANGDPALLENYADDPSNVHHSYLNDRVVFRNFHAGPKETHVFHLHAHQWFAGNDPNRGAYLDSQTVGPEQGFSYDIYHGGLERYSPRDPAKKRGWWETLGAGNRNRSPGDSIFHCHLYPHFAQGMWELWRNHDVLEDGSRRLPDGQSEPGYSVKFNNSPEKKRSGSVNLETGTFIPDAPGTPVPAVVPMPDQALPLLPSYPKTQADGKVVAGTAATGMPGYPFYIAGQPGHRPPQAPMDIAVDGGLPRHVVTGGERKFEVSGAETLKAASKNEEAFRKAGQQYVAKVAALGNFAAHLESAKLKMLGKNGTALERAAMGFHFEGQRVEFGVDGLKPGGSTLILSDARGEKSDFIFEEGGYRTLLTPKPGHVNAPGSLVAEAWKDDPAFFHVNGAPPKPGAPFADPCAVASGMTSTALNDDGTFVRPDKPLSAINDPLMAPDGRLPVGEVKFVPDPGMRGFRRYEVSAVQLDLVTNKAGWHDPQARINVLTEKSREYKKDNNLKVSAKEKPFFFRAASGECIEFRHTNELPKELDLDDFQVKTPTDTIGQHIHLVKFDVTASDGSGNGWNYEDGTFAPDEVAARICAAELDPTSSVEEKKIVEERKQKLCNGNKPKENAYWRKAKTPGSEQELPFQTTIQRWFADPILSKTEKTDENSLADRTMRTVFTHDHFGPSSIQQHGFYSALVIEPPKASVCSAEKDRECNSLETRLDAVAKGTEDLTGDAKLVKFDLADKSKTAMAHENYREFVLAIADFATLYDPRDTESVADFDKKFPFYWKTIPKEELKEKPHGMATLLCEVALRSDPEAMKKRCDSNFGQDKNGYFGAAGDTPPAWLAGGMAEDTEGHKFGNDLFTSHAEIQTLRDRLVEHRRFAAGCLEGDTNCQKLAKPVAPPKRPESISVDHHDPYLVNYRGEPIPLRVGGKSEGVGATRTVTPCTLNEVEDWVVHSELRNDATPCSVNAQRPGAEGDMANAFRSMEHGDPATPILNSYDGERVAIRMIQGAQEVQHVFNLDGYSWTRNIDQTFPAGSRRLETSPKLKAQDTLHQRCIEDGRVGKPLEYRDWFTGSKKGDAFWDAYEQRIANCDNVDGRSMAQEIGISEHFEFTGQFREQLAGTEKLVREDNAQAVRQLGSTDYHYHFGSADDLWNGAWGLLRVYPNTTTLESTAYGNLLRSKNVCEAKAEKQTGYDSQKTAKGECAKAFEAAMENVKQISLTLAPLPRRGRTESTSTPGPVDLPVACPTNAPRHYVTAVAVERSALGLSGSHGGTLSDPDGLFLGQLSWSDLPGVTSAAGDSPSDAEWHSYWTSPNVPAIKAKVKLGGAKLFNFEVPAGACVNLAVVNGLESVTDKLGLTGLRDVLGDARMPPITPLNVEPAHNVKEEGSLISSYETLNFERDEENLRPSSKFAMRMQLPVLNDASTIAMPAGWNMTGAFGPGNTELLTFYTGRARLPNFTNPPGKDPVDEEIRDEYDQPLKLQSAVQRVCDSLKDVTVPTTSGIFKFPTTCTKAKPGKALANQVAFLSFNLDLPDFPSIDLDRTAVRAVWDAAARDVASDLTHWVPYAFGPVPLKSFGDVIGHPTHGLIGMINVRPANWLLSSQKPQKAGNVPSTAYCLPKLGATACESDDQHVRSFTLAIQDGLNLHDSASKLQPKDEKGQPLEDVLSTKQKIIPLPDCPTCNDSYDFGQKSVSYNTTSFAQLLRKLNVSCPQKSRAETQPESDTDLNTCVFPADFFAQGVDHGASVLKACAGEEVLIRAVHPGGRQRQHTITAIGFGYDDLFPGFGFPNSALLGPGKVISANLTVRAKPGLYLWMDGTSTLREGGIWGLLSVETCN